MNVAAGTAVVFVSLYFILMLAGLRPIGEEGDYNLLYFGFDYAVILAYQLLKINNNNYIVKTLALVIVFPPIIYITFWSWFVLFAFSLYVFGIVH